MVYLIFWRRFNMNMGMLFLYFRIYNGRIAHSNFSSITLIRRVEAFYNLRVCVGWWRQQAAHNDLHPRIHCGHSRGNAITPHALVERLENGSFNTP